MNNRCFVAAEHSGQNPTLRVFPDFRARWVMDCKTRGVPHAVLIADDDPPLLNLLETMVSRSGDFDVVTCRDGQEAIEALETRHFDVILLDLMMPRRSGFDVIEFLQAHKPEQLRVVLVLTAGVDEFARRLDPSVVHALVAKPFDCKAVIALIRTLVAAGSSTPTDVRASA